MTVEKALEVGSAKIEIAYERFGNIQDPPVLLIMGVGGQMLEWNEGFINQLVAKGLHVIRFDNRDVGLSTHYSKAPVPNLAAALSGDLSSVYYTLSDMAADTVGLLDNLGLDSAHIVGASMGGFIAQTIAIEYPHRIRSLTSMMSTTGNMTVGQPNLEAMSLFARLPPISRQQVLDRAVASFRVVGSPAFALDEKEVRHRTGLAYDRCYDPLGAARQAIASVASGDRTRKLKSVTVPTLVIHGADDKMCNVSGGRATAGAIPGAELVIIEGMGHDLPKDLWPKLVSLISEFITQIKERKIS